MFGLGDKNSTRAVASFVAKEATYAAGCKKKKKAEADVAVLLTLGEGACARTERRTYVRRECLSASLTTPHATKAKTRANGGIYYLAERAYRFFGRFILRRIRALAHRWHANL